MTTDSRRADHPRRAASGIGAPANGRPRVRRGGGRRRQLRGHARAVVPPRRSARDRAVRVVLRSPPGSSARWRGRMPFWCSCCSWRECRGSSGASGSIGSPYGTAGTVSPWYGCSSGTRCSRLTGTRRVFTCLSSRRRVDFISHYPDVLMAFAGLGLLIAVGVTSARAARRALSREAWHADAPVRVPRRRAVVRASARGRHRLQRRPGRPYLVDHAVCRRVRLDTGVAGRMATAVQRPSRASRPRRSVQRRPGVVSIYLSGRRLDELEAQSGQFFLWRFLTRDRWWKAHPFSLSAAPTDRGLRITVKDLGDDSGSLSDPAQGHAGVRRGTVRNVHGGATAPAEGAPDRRAESGSRRCVPCSRRFRPIPAT